MPLSLHPKTEQKPKRKKPALFFVIIAVLLVSILAYLIKYIITPKFIQNLPINYHIELNLAKYGQISPLWLENNPDREKLLNYLKEFYQKYISNPPKNLFTNKISLINVVYTPEDYNDSSLPAVVPTGAKAGLQDELIILAQISSPETLTKYLKTFTKISQTEDEKINILVPLIPITNHEIFYFSFTKNNQFILTSNQELLKLALKNKINLNFPKENILSPLSGTFPNEFLKIYSKPSKLPVLSQFFQTHDSPIWFSFELEPQKIVVNFKNNFPKPQKLPETWFNLLSTNQDIIIFNKNLASILDNPAFFQNQINNDLYPMLENNQAALFLTPKTPKYTLSWSDYHPTLVISNQNWAQNSKEIKKIEQTAKNIFAQKFPSEKIATLPDKSIITQLITTPEDFKFQEKKVANISIKYLQKPNLEFAYAFADDKILFSTSINLLEQTLTQKKSLKSVNFLTNCLNTQNIPSDFVFFSPNLEFQTKYGLNQLILTNEKACVY